jgi:predicted RNA methylase
MAVEIPEKVEPPRGTSYELLMLTEAVARLADDLVWDLGVDAVGHLSPDLVGAVYARRREMARLRARDRQVAGRC